MGEDEHGLGTAIDCLVERVTAFATSGDMRAALELRAAEADPAGTADARAALASLPAVAHVSHDGEVGHQCSR